MSGKDTKLIFLDIDGTLVQPGENTPPESAVQAIRAAQAKGNKVFLAQSRHRMTLTEFAAECAKISSNAVYLDMGEYGYGYIGNKILSPWAYFSRNKQTNWIYVK